MAKILGRRSAWIGIPAGLCSLASLAAQAQQPPANDDRALDEVVVTAQKREERSIDVPTVINSVKAEDLAAQNLTGIRDYYSRVPGLAYDGNKTYSLSLRGITTGSFTSPTLSILLDDVQFGATTAAGLGNSLFPDFDPSILERIEVLHGPQGTLYGAASLGGLIKFVTRQPDTEHFSARLEAGMQSTKGGDTGWGARGTINIPLISGKLALRVSGFNREDPAYIDNIQPGLEGKDVNDAHIRGGHASLLFKPVENLAITLSALQQKRDADFSPSTRVNADADLVPNYDPLFGEDTVQLASTSDVGNQRLYSGRVVFDAGNFEITSITAYGKSAGTNFQDVSSVFAFLGAPPFYNMPVFVSIDDVAHTNKFSQELRLGGTVGRVDWRTGVFYTREKSSVDQALHVFDSSGTFVATAYDGLGPNSYRERAVFGDVVFHVSDQWDLQAGARYAKNKQSSGGSVIIDGPAQPAFGPSGENPDLFSRDNSTTWAVSPIYHFTPDLMAYLRVATGYRPGGPNAVLPNVPASFAPDKVTNYELGFKGILADRRFSWETALFQIDWRDVQLQDTDASTQFTYTTNGGKARSRGVELAAGWRPAAGLSVDANVSVMDAQLTETIATVPGADTLVGASGDRLPSSAKFASNLSVQQDFPISDQWSAFVGANWSRVGDRKSSFISTAAGAPRFTLPGYSLLDLRAGLNHGADWHLNLFVRNVTDKRGVVTADNRNGTNLTSEGVPVTFVNFLQPRTIGFSVAKEF